MSLHSLFHVYCIIGYQSKFILLRLREVLSCIELKNHTEYSIMSMDNKIEALDKKMEEQAKLISDLCNKISKLWQCIMWKKNKSFPIATVSIKYFVVTYYLWSCLFFWGKS